MDTFPKFIVEGDCLILSNCTYHKELITDLAQVRGGGLFRFDKDDNAFILSDKSFDFGRPTIEDLKACISAGKVYTNPHKTHSIHDKYKFYYMEWGDKIALN